MRTLFKNHQIPHYAYFCFTILSILSWQLLPINAKEPIKLGLQYSIPKNQKLELRVTQVPKKLPWLEKDEEGILLAPENDSIIVAQTIEDIEIMDQYGSKKTIPAETKFYAKVLETTPAKSFWRKGKAKLEFFAIDPYAYTENFEPDYSMSKYNGKDFIQPSKSISQVKLEANLDYNSKGNSFKDTVKNLSSTGGYAVAGAIAAPFAVFALTGIAGKALAFSAVSNPYVLGGAAAVGASAGLAYGIMKKGKTINLEPGSELEIKLENPWLIVSALEKSESKNHVLENEENKNFELDILKVKKARDEFGDRCIKISIYYENYTEEEMHYSSFQLVDSMGKEYEPSISSFDANIFGELPKKGNLDLYFNAEFPKTLHQLRALRIYDQKPLAIADIRLQ